MSDISTPQSSIAVFIDYENLAKESATVIKSQDIFQK